MMNKKAAIIAVALIIAAGLLYFYFNQADTGEITEYKNDQYGFTLAMDEKFKESVEIKAEDHTVYFVSREIQAQQPDMVFGVVGRIEIYDKSEFTKDKMLEAGDSYGLKYLGENETYLFGYAHATDVQVPPGDEKLLEKFRSLELDFDQIIKSFKTFPPAIQASDVKTDTGRYVGLADNNFFEVKINGMPEDKAFKVFMISEKVRSSFEQLDLQEDEEIKLKYIENQHGQNVVQEITRIVKYQKISDEEAKNLMDSETGIVIVDVRTPEEYASGYIPDALNIPNETITTSSQPELLPDKDAKILIYCRSGNRSQQASQKLIDMGYSRVYDFGGIKDWPYETVKE